jgi:hypothetical protein
VREQPAQVSGHRLGIAVQLSPGDADAPEAGHSQLTIALAIGLEGATRPVSGVTIKLDDHPLLRP